MERIFIDENEYIYLTEKLPSIAEQEVMAFKEVEFRVPLEKVGLNGLNKEIQFMIKSDADPETCETDWVCDGKPIIFTNGINFY